MSVELLCMALHSKNSGQNSRDDVFFHNVCFLFFVSAKLIVLAIKANGLFGKYEYKKQGYLKSIEIALVLIYEEK